MEIKFTILVKGSDGNEQNIAYTTSKEYTKKMLNILLDGIDPNNLNDIVIHPTTEK